MLYKVTELWFFSYSYLQQIFCFACLLLYSVLVVSTNAVDGLECYMSFTLSWYEITKMVSVSWLYIVVWVMSVFIKLVSAAVRALFSINTVAVVARTDECTSWYVPHWGSRMAKSPNDISWLRRPENVKFGTKVASSTRMMHTLRFLGKVS